MLQGSVPDMTARVLTFRGMRIPPGACRFGRTASVVKSAIDQSQPSALTIVWLGVDKMPRGRRIAPSSTRSSPLSLIRTRVSDKMGRRN